MKPLNSLVSYFQGVGVELRKVTWPAFPVLVRYFFSVVIGMGLATLFIWAVDYLFLHLLTYIIK